jgi:hypothetical protein
MIVHNIRLDHSDGYRRLCASVAWEEAARKPQELEFRFLSDQSTIDPTSCADPFLTALAPIAFRHGERRISVEGTVCPLLVENLYTALGYLRDWYWYEYDLARDEPLRFSIEASRYQVRHLEGNGSAAAFFSGGVDSFDLMLHNHETLSEGHPLRIREALFAWGLDFGTRQDRGDEEAFFAETRARFEPWLNSIGVKLVPAWTTVRFLDRDTHGWQFETHGSAMAAIGQCLGNYTDNFWIASSYDIPALHPWGSHPILDRCYSTSATSFHHARERFTRLNKIAYVAKNQEALDLLRVCFFGDEAHMNCGRCEKCIRTRIGLLIAGKLEQAGSMPYRELTFDEIARNVTLSPSAAIFARECLAPLRSIGRSDLANALRLKLLQRRLRAGSDLRAALKYVDKHALGGRLKRRKARD